MTIREAERAATTNAAAFRFWLRAAGIADLADDAALHRFAADRQVAFHAAVLRFAGIAGPTARLVEPSGTDQRQALVLLGADGARRAWDRAALAGTAHPDLPADIAGALARTWPAAALAPALAAVLLQADLRPDDLVLVAGLPAWPWLAALTQDIPLILAPSPAAGALRRMASAEQASVVAAPLAWLKAESLDDAPPSGPRGVCPDPWPGAWSIHDGMAETARPRGP